ncbi:MAG TPA: hypothetical protein VGS23_06060 [Thermoplasmata archaeon]|nr:hypothetical protein [Thermoplasmata archaeon]
MVERPGKFYDHLWIRGRELRYSDREHGRTAQPYDRKHCQGCGKTLPNRSRSWICPVCYPDYRRDTDALRRRRLRARRRGDV